MTRDLVIRAARRDDVPAIVALLADDVLGSARESTVDDAYRRAYDAIAADPRTELVVAEAADGTVIGTLQVTFIPSLTHHGGERAEIEGVRVAHELRGDGVGMRLVEWVIDTARGRGCRLVQLTSDERRVDARRFYERLGFRATHVGLKLRLP